MALLKFKQGLVSDLPAYVGSGEDSTVGVVYITSDSQEMKVDLPSRRVSISDFIIVNTQSELDAIGTYHENLFYYVKADNLLKKYTKNPAEGEGNWKNINDVSALESSIASLGARILTAEGDIDALEGRATNLETAVSSINASTIETTQKIVVTKAVGNYEKGETIEIDDIQDIIKNMLSTDIAPTVTQPSASVSLTNAGAKEVGSTFTPNYSFSTSAGSYSKYRDPDDGVEKNQSTGVTFSGYSITESGRPDNKTAATKNTKTGSFESFIVTDDVSYNLVDGYCESTAGNVPKSYLGVEDTSKQIQAKTYKNLTTSSVTGYRGCFYGYYNSKQLNPNALTSDQVRGLIGNDAIAKSTLGGYLTNGQVTTNKMQQMFFAAPAGKYSSITVKNSSNDAPQTVKKCATPVYVKGYNNYMAAGDETTNGGMAYDVWYVDNAGAESGSTTFNVTIS